MKTTKIIKTNDMNRKINNILDKRYFHVCTSFNDRCVGNIEWEIYYSNLPENLYFSNKNKSLLSSKRNIISDIYALKDRFEKEKQLIIKANIEEYIKISYENYSNMSKIKSYFTETIVDILLINVFLVFFNILFFKSVEISILNLINTILIAILAIRKNIKIDKKINKFQNDIEENYIQEKIRQQGLYFVEKLRKQIY